MKMLFLLSISIQLGTALVTSVQQTFILHSDKFKMPFPWLRKYVICIWAEEQSHSSWTTDDHQMSHSH